MSLDHPYMGYWYRRRLRRVIAAPPNNSPSNLWGLCKHLDLPKARQVERKARIVAMTFALNSLCWTKRMLRQMQMCINKVIQKLCFLRFCHDLGSPWASRRQPRRRNRNCPQKIDPGLSFSRGYFRLFLCRRRFFVHFVCANSYAYFWHRFWEASCSNFVDCGVISGCLLGSFWTLFCRCCKP